MAKCENYGRHGNEAAAKFSKKDYSYFKMQQQPQDADNCYSASFHDLIL